MTHISRGRAQWWASGSAWLLAMLGLGLLTGCGSGAAASPSPVSPAPPPSPPPASTPGNTLVYSMSNDSTANAVLEFRAKADGSLTQANSYPTGGRGSGGGLQNQGAVALNEDRTLLFVVNAGSDDFSVFRVAPGGLTFVALTPAGGHHPVSIAARKGVLYVLNLSSIAGGANVDGIAGFRVAADGTVAAIPGSARALSQPATRAAQVSVSPNAGLVLVTERSTALIDSFVLGAQGAAAAKVANPSSGTIPFGFQFLDESHVVVAEEGALAASSYVIAAGGAISVVSASVVNGQQAVCWLAITPDGRYAFTGNTTGRSISAYSIAGNGALSLLAGGLSAATDGPALDVAVSADGKHLYVVLAGGGLETFAIAPGGGLKKVQTLQGLPPALNGVIS